MANIREILRLDAMKELSKRKIGYSVGCSHNTVKSILKKANEVGLKWPLPEDLSDDKLEQLIYPNTKSTVRDRPEPDLKYIESQLHEPGVNLTILWHEYKSDNPDGLQYTQFCERYRRYIGYKNITMHLSHKPGEELFVDWCGDPMQLINRETGKTLPAYLFVTAMGMSGYPYVEAFNSKISENWICGHIHAFEHMGRLPLILVPDNDKSAVTKANYYEPSLNKTYQEIAQYYDCAVIPARVRRPRDKAKVESTVRDVETWIIAALRKQVFFNLADLNRAIKEKLKEYSEKPFQKREGSRKSEFLKYDYPKMRPLPDIRYEYAEWKTAKVNSDYHVEVEKRYYSVPYIYAYQKVDVRTTKSIIEIFQKGLRIASHKRSTEMIRTYITDVSHMPEKHKFYATIDKEQFVTWSKTIGPYTADMVRKIFGRSSVEQKHYRSCMGLRRVYKLYGKERFEIACQMAIDATCYGSSYVEQILKANLDKKEKFKNSHKIIQHSNIRGGKYYGKEE